MMLLGALFGAGVAGVILLLWRALTPAPTRLDVDLARLYEPLPPPVRGYEARRRWRSWSLTAMERLGGSERRGLEADLEVVGESVERHAVTKLGFAVAGAGVPLAVYGVWLAAGVNVSPVLLVPAAMVLGPLGWFLPDLRVKQLAENERRNFRHALLLYLELVMIGLSCGLGVGTSMQRASYAGSGWAFQSMRVALRAAKHAGRPPWEALRELGERIGSQELIGLASSMTQAGTSGSRQRTALESRLEMARDHEFIDAKRDATKASEKMGIPVMGMIGCLLALVLAPAAARLMAI